MTITERIIYRQKKQFEDILSVYPNEPVSKHYIQLLTEDLGQTEMDFANKILQEPIPLY